MHFNSRPRVGGDLNGVLGVAPAFDFNSRPRVGGDINAAINVSKETGISIHAPA